MNGQLTNVPLPQDQWTVPLASFTGSFTSGLNEFNGSAQFNYAAKHNPMVFFTELDHPESIQRYAYCAGSGLQGLTGDAAKILQGDDFLRQVVPMIMASDA